MTLAFDSSTPHCSVALDLHTHIDYIEEVLSDYTHTDKLFEYIDSLLGRHLVRPADLKSLIVGLGPGSYTGLRVAASAAKGLAYALDIPVYGVSSLELIFKRFLNLHSPKPDDLIITAIDARRMEVYASAFTPDGKVLFENQAVKVKEDTWSALFDQFNKVWIAGTGVSKLHAVLHRSQLQIIDGIYPSATDALRIYHTKGAKSLDLAYFEPYYVKEFGER